MAERDEETIAAEADSEAAEEADSEAAAASEEAAEEDSEEEEEGWYSVWAQPAASSELKAALEAAMERLRKERGDGALRRDDSAEEEEEEEGSDLPPVFEPHLTVLAVHPSRQNKIPLRRAIRALRSASRSLSPFSCLLARPSSGSTFYQSVFMLVDPSPQVMNANEHVRRFFASEASPEDYGGSAATDYMPHLSLYYGLLSDESKAKAQHIVEAEFGAKLSGKEFTVSSLALYNTDTSDKSLKSWRKVAEFPLLG